LYCAKDILKEGDIACDVGSNHGHISYAFSKFVGEKGKVFAFEPNEKLSQAIRKNIVQSNTKNVSVVQKAVSNISKDQANFFVDTRKGSFESSLNKKHLENDETRKNKNAPYKKIILSTITLDDFFIKNKRNKVPKLIKIDVEGCETKVLKGSQNLIKKYNPYFIFEYCFWLKREDDPILYLQKKGYEFYDCSLGHKVNRDFYLNRNCGYFMYTNISRKDPWKNMYFFPNKINLFRKQNKLLKTLKDFKNQFFISKNQKKIKRRYKYFSLDWTKKGLCLLNLSKNSEKDIVIEIKEEDLPISNC
jgi:FkbM family methyltransferase